jgi:hypothetical protein
MELVWHLEVDFKVKPLDLEPVFNVYNLPVGMGPFISERGSDMGCRLIAIATAVFSFVATTALAASRVGGSGCCPPCPFCH